MILVLKYIYLSLHIVWAYYAFKFAVCFPSLIRPTIYFKSDIIWGTFLFNTQFSVQLSPLLEWQKHFYITFF